MHNIFERIVGVQSNISAVVLNYMGKGISLTFSVENIWKPQKGIIMIGFKNYDTRLELLFNDTETETFFSLGTQSIPSLQKVLPALKYAFGAMMFV